jgi:hypothetical protein
MTPLQAFRLDFAHLCIIEATEGVYVGHRSASLETPGAAYYTSREITESHPDPKHLLKMAASIGPRGGKRKR